MKDQGLGYCIEAHLLDSLLLSQLLDQLATLRVEYLIEEWKIGPTRKVPSRICLRLWPSKKQLEPLRLLMSNFDAEEGEPETGEVEVAPSPKDGVYPGGFITTSNQPTEVFYKNQWLKVEDLCMDAAIKVAHSKAKAVKFFEVKKGDLIAVSDLGVRVHLPPPHSNDEGFHFMGSHVSSEKPWQQVITNIAKQIKGLKGKKKVLLVGGPAIVHTGAAVDLSNLIEEGWVQLLFAGNALATHDIEAALLGTSLGVDLKTGQNQHLGNRHHLQAINKIRQLGGISQAVKQGVLTAGIMHTCIKNDVDFVLAGSIRDDGPLPEVITDAIEAQKAMKARLPEVGLVLMVATLLHSVAVGNLLPAGIPTYMVDIHLGAATKLGDRGTGQAESLVMDAKSFLHELRLALGP
ncbi:MAG: TIGR00300 family protein [SAR324 cluster bacterium]|nr:TIGR00300 family protein [SAR324 cluster bacterium]